LVAPSLSFSIDHAILAATTTKAPHADPEFLQLVSGPSKSGGPVTPQQQKLRALAFARHMTELGYDKEWLSDPKNRAIVEGKIPDMIVGRPAVVIGMLVIVAFLFPFIPSSSHSRPYACPFVVMGLITSLAFSRCFNTNYSSMHAFLALTRVERAVWRTAISPTGSHRTFRCIPFVHVLTSQFLDSHRIHPAWTGLCHRFSLSWSLGIIPLETETHP
jgi:hypothetical protein